MVANNLSQHKEALRRRKKQRRIKYSIFFFVFVTLIGVLSYVSYRPSFRISEVELTGGLLVTEKEIEQSSLDFMRGSYFWLFPKNNAFLYKKNKLETYLSDKFKRIDTIDIKLDGLNKIMVNITERKPEALWCKENITELSTSTEGNLLSKEKCYFIDSLSTIFAPAPDFSGDVYFRYYGLVDSENPIGLQYISSTTEFIKINNFIKLIRDLNTKPLFLKTLGEGEFSLNLYGGGEIFFDSKKSLELAYKNLETLLSSSEISLRNGYLPVEYIDLRYGNKIFYKLK